MSQTGFLEDVVSWDETRCLQHVDQALPKLVSASSAEEEIGILKIICHSFLPCVRQHEAEQKVFSKITSKTCDSFDKILEGIKSAAQEQNAKSEEISTSIAMAVEVVECMEGCIRHLLSRKEQVELAHIHSLPGCTLHLLSQSYTHCRDSGDLYKDLLGLLSEPLSAFFRKSHSLQMAFLNLLHQTVVGGEATDQDVQDLCQVCEGLYEVCQIVTALDMKVVVSLWKAVSKVASKHKELLQGHLNVCGMVRYLCEEISEGYQYLFQLLPRQDQEGMVQSQGDEKAFMKSIKILGFQMKILVHLVKDFQDFLGQCESSLFFLIITIHRHLPPSLCGSRLETRHQDHITSQIVVAVDPLITSLITSSTFRQCVTKHHRDLEVDQHLPLLQLQISIMKMLPKLSVDDQTKWISPAVNTEDVPVEGIVQAVFTSVGRCFVEFSLPVYLPGVGVAGKQQRNVSLYEYVCTSLSGFIGSFPAQHFSVLEDCLLLHCLSHNPYQSTLAVDCWCFMARFGSADLCQQHVGFLLQLYQEVTRGCHAHLAAQRLASLIHRLVKFLAPRHQQQILLKDYQPSLNLGLWAEIPLSSLTSNISRDVTDELVTSSIKVLNNWNTAADKCLSQLHTVILSLKCLNNIYSSPLFVEKFVTPQQQSMIVDKLCQTWKIFSSSEWNMRPALELMLGESFRLSGHLVRYLNTADILQILNVTQKILLEPSAVVLRLEVVSFLQRCGAVTLPPSFEQNQVLRKLPDVFCQVLKDSDSIVLHNSLIAFTRFAEETVHESVVSECMEKDGTLQDKVVNFLNKIPSAVSQHQLSTTDYLKEQLQALNTPISVMGPASTDLTSYEPSTKRARTESSGNKEETRRDSLLQQLQSTCTDIESLMKVAHQPAWFVAGVKHSLEQLSRCLQDQPS